jgi:hypothetical protein
MHVFANDRISLFWSIPLSLSVYSLMTLKLMPVSWLSWILLQWTWVCKHPQHTDFTSFGCIPRSRLAGHVIVLFLTFCGNSILFSIMAVLIYIPSVMYKCSLFSTSLSTLIAYLFDNSNPINKNNYIIYKLYYIICKLYNI